MPLTDYRPLVIGHSRQTKQHCQLTRLSCDCCPLSDHTQSGSTHVIRLMTDKASFLLTFPDTDLHCWFIGLSLPDDTHCQDHFDIFGSLFMTPYALSCKVSGCPNLLWINVAEKVEGNRLEGYFGALFSVYPVDNRLTHLAQIFRHLHQVAVLGVGFNLAELIPVGDQNLWAVSETTKRSDLQWTVYRNGNVARFNLGKKLFKT